MKRKRLFLTATLLLSLLGNAQGQSIDCGTAQLPWLETFAGGDDCWYKPAGSLWQDVIPYNDTTLESMRYLYLQMQHDYQGSWIMSQAIQIPADSNLQPRLFWKVASNTNSYALHYGVLVTTSADYTNTSNYTQIYYDDDTHLQWSNYQQLSVSLAQYAGQVIHIAFHNSPNMCPPDDRCVCIDDVEIRAIAMPTVNLMAEDIAYLGQSFTARASLSEGSTTNLSFTWHSSLLDSTWTTTADSTGIVYPIAGIDSLTVTANNIYGSCTAVAIINVISGCNAVPVPYVVNFEGLTPTNFSAAGNLPGCWTYGWNGTIAAYAPHVITTAGYPFSGLGNIPDNALLMQAGMYSGTCAEVMLPGFIAPLQTLQLALDSRFESATQGVLEVGYYDNSDFIPLQTIAHQTNSYQRDTVSFANVIASNAHIAIRFTCNSWYGVIIDNIEVFLNSTIETDSLPWIAITPSPNPAMALRDTVAMMASLMAGDTTGLVWTWSHTLPCTVMGSGASHWVVYTAVGFDTVRAIATNAHGSDTATAVVTVKGEPHVTLSGVTSATTGDTITFTTTLTNSYTEGLAYNWHSALLDTTFVDSAINSQLSIVYPSAGTDTITLEVCNALGCDTASRVVTVYDCAPRAVPYVEDFSSFYGDFNLNDVVNISIPPQYLDEDLIPGCWNYVWEGAPAHRPFVFDPSLHPDLTFINRIGSKALLMAAGTASGYDTVAYVMLPAFAAPLQNLTLVVDHLEENFNYGTLTVGYMQNEIFSAVADITNNVYTLVSDTVIFDTVSMAVANARMALRWVSHSSYWGTAIERIEVFGDTAAVVPPDTMWRTVTVTANVAGACETFGSGLYADSSTVEIGYSMIDSAIVGGHWQFLGWSDGPTDNPRQIVVISDTSIIALFEWVADSVGIHENIDVSSAITIYPNPAHGEVTIRVDHPSVVSVYDACGRKVARMEEEDTLFVFDASRLPSGIYLVKVSNGKGMAVRKLIVK